jgi:hypothetical protein
MTARGYQNGKTCALRTCGKVIPRQRVFNAQVRGRPIKYCSDSCGLKAARKAYKARQQQKESG